MERILTLCVFKRNRSESEPLTDKEVSHSREGFNSRLRHLKLGTYV